MYSDHREMRAASGNVAADLCFILDRRKILRAAVNNFGIDNPRSLWSPTLNYEDSTSFRLINQNLVRIPQKQFKSLENNMPVRNRDERCWRNSSISSQSMISSAEGKQNCLVSDKVHNRLPVKRISTVWLQSQRDPHTLGTPLKCASYSATTAVTLL